MDKESSDKDNFIQFLLPTILLASLRHFTLVAKSSLMRFSPPLPSVTLSQPRQPATTVTTTASLLVPLPHAFSHPSPTCDVPYVWTFCLWISPPFSHLLFSRNKK